MRGSKFHHFPAAEVLGCHVSYVRTSHSKCFPAAVKGLTLQGFHTRGLVLVNVGGLGIDAGLEHNIPKQGDEHPNRKVVKLMSLALFCLGIIS